jgi:hypothetical protein
VRDIRTAIGILRFNNVPAHEDGLYHWHLDPMSERRSSATTSSSA